MNEENKFDPRPYDLTKPAELVRLYRETKGYLKVCLDHHHGTDFDGRKYAMEALTSLYGDERKKVIRLAIDEVGFIIVSKRLTDPHDIELFKELEEEFKKECADENEKILSELGL